MIHTSNGTCRQGTRRDFSHIRLSYVVSVYFNEGDCTSLESLLRTYSGYSADLLDGLQFVVVDDASPVPATVPPDIPINLLLLRIHEDIPWNQPGARNLGVVYARSDKVLLTDLDHEVPENTLRYVFRMRNPGRTMYQIRRFDDRNKPIKPHPNTFVLSRGRFLLYYGYDEDFCGHYGCDDSVFRRWQRNHGTRFRFLPSSCHIRMRNMSRTGGHSLARDLSHNKALARKKKQFWNEYGPEAGHSRRFLDFSWRIVEDRCRANAPLPGKRRRLWAKTWWWRWLWGG